MKFEACIRVSEPNPLAKAKGKAKWDVVAVKPTGSVWGEAERNGGHRIVVIETDGTEDDRVAGQLQALVDLGVSHPFVVYPYEDATVKSTLRIDLSTVDPARVASGTVIRETEGYSRKLAGSRALEI